MTNKTYRATIGGYGVDFTTDTHYYRLIMPVGYRGIDIPATVSHLSGPCWRVYVQGASVDALVVIERPL